MDAVGRVWQELKEAGSPCGGRLHGGRLPLSSFQFPKEKKWGNQQGKIFKTRQALKSFSSTAASAPASHLPDGKEELASPRPDLSKGKTVYSFENWQALAGVVQRHANILKEDSSNAKRYQCLSKLEHIFIETAVPHAFYTRAFLPLSEPLLLCLSDPTEAARQAAASLLSKFLTEVTEVDGVLGQVLEGLVQRFGSQDIEGVAHLPPIMRPEPEYKPLQLTPVETSEDVRKTLFQLLRTALDRSSDDSVWDHLDLATGLLRAGAMDVCPDIKSVALHTLVEFCDRHQQMLLHFTEPMARSVLSCLVHQHAKIRMGALRALTHVLACGLYKYNGEIIQMLAGWRDPNFVPIKSLYEPTTIRNYFAELLADHSPLVRMFFFDTLARWLLEFADKADYETWIFPYLLSGLFDPFRPIQQLVFSLLELLGKHYESTHEKDLRDIKQLGTPEPWSYDGRAFIRFPLGGRWEMAEQACITEETEQFVSFVSSYSERLCNLGFEGCSLSEKQKNKFLSKGGALVGDPARPCLGTRMMVKTYFRRYAKTLFEPVEDFKEVTMATSARLMVVSLAYIEDAAVEWLDNCLTICARVLSSSQSHSEEALEAYRVAMRLVGVFIDPENYWNLVKDALEGRSHEEIYERVGMLALLALMLEGSFKALQQASDSTLGLGRLAPIVPKIADALAHTDLLHEQFVGFAAESVTKVVQILVSGTLRQEVSFSAMTWHHLLSVICSLALPSNGADDESHALPPHIQELLGHLARCHEAPSTEISVAMSADTMWFYAPLSMSLPPSNLGALNIFLKWLPSLRLLEEKIFSVIIAKLEEFSAATQAAATRRNARRTALRLARRLMLLGPADIRRIRGNAPTAETHGGGRAAGVVAVMESSALQWRVGESEKSTTGDEKAHPMESIIHYTEPRRFPTKAAAEILTRVVLGRLRKLDCVEDLEDTLGALAEFLALPQPATSAAQQAIQDTIVMSGLAEDLSWLLREPCLHTKLFRAASEAYAHEWAATYPDKCPAMALEDMPLGKRRELRLSAIRTATALKDQAVLLLRVTLTCVARQYDTVRLILSSAIASLHPPDKLQKLSVTRVWKSCEAPKAETPAGEKRQCSEGVREEPDKQRGPSTEEEAVAATRGTSVQCSSSLPFQAQSPWFLFQLAGFLLDAVVHGTSCHVGGSNEAKLAPEPGDLPCDWCLPLLTMPLVRQIPVYSHLQLQTARQILLELCTESDLCQAVDSCVRHIVELQSASSESAQLLKESLVEGPSRRAADSGNLKELLITAQRQGKRVPIAIQKEQARRALTEFIRFVGSIFPSAVQECRRQYEASGRFCRRDTLVRVLQERSRPTAGLMEAAGGTAELVLET